jgi:beta-aspartyl-peptidase (threonine type)
MPIPALIVHGGAGDIPKSEQANYLAGCRVAFEVGWHLLDRGESALDAIEAAVRSMEDNATFDAGVGSVLNSIGEIELDAMIMEGANLHLGAVAAVRGIANPITLARRVMENTTHSVLVGAGARRYAEQIGLRLCSQAELTVPREVARFREQQRASRQEIPAIRAKQAVMDTVGAVAIDRAGNVAAATSTGGTAFKLPGRVGDSPLVGSGAYADNQSGAASATGHGEMIMRVLLSKTATDAIANGLNAQEAADRAIAIFRERVGGAAGVIVVDREGHIGFAHSSLHMAAAWQSPDGEIHTYIGAG